MFGIIKKIFIILLSDVVNGCNHAQCMIHPTLVNVHPNKYSQEFHYYLFAVKLDRCVGSYNTLNDLSNEVCVPNKAEDLNLSIFNMITGINESKTLTKHISCEYECRFDGRKCNSDQWWNNRKCRCECNEETNFSEKNATCKTQNFYILLAFLLIAIALLIGGSIYCYLITYRAITKRFIIILLHK